MSNSKNGFVSSNISKLVDRFVQMSLFLYIILLMSINIPIIPALYIDAENPVIIMYIMIINIAKIKFFRFPVILLNIDTPIIKNDMFIPDTASTCDKLEFLKFSIIFSSIFVLSPITIPVNMLAMSFGSISYN